MGYQTAESSTISTPATATWQPTIRAGLAPRDASGTASLAVAIRPHQAGLSSRRAGAAVKVGTSRAGVAIAGIVAARDVACYTSQTACLVEAVHNTFL